MGHENGDKQRETKSRHVQGMLDETEPLRNTKGNSWMKVEYIQLLKLRFQFVETGKCHPIFVFTLFNQLNATN